MVYLVRLIKKDLKLTHLYLKLTHRSEFHTSREILSGNYRTDSSNAEDSGLAASI